MESTRTFSRSWVVPSLSVQLSVSVRPMTTTVVRLARVLSVRAR